MSDVRDQLIELFARFRVAEVPARLEYQALCAANVNDPQRSIVFNEERNAIEQTKKRLEGLLDGKPRAEQVGEALRELFRGRGERGQARCYELIKRGYKSFWTQDQQDYFDRGWKLVNLQYDFFLSFTTRNSSPDSENLVNDRYRYFIRKTLGERRVKAADLRKKNLLAEAVHRLLAEGSRNGFFFPHIQYDNSETEKKLQQALENSLCFIQLVQNIMFGKPQQQRKNYCFFEYDKSWRMVPDDDRVLFIVAEPEAQLLARHRVPVDYDGWHAHVSRKDPPYLTQADQLGPKQGAHLTDLLRTKVIDHLEKFWVDLFTKVPS